MNVLVACEESQRVCNAFRDRGHMAYSCDILEPSGGHPECHILGDVLPILKGGAFRREFKEYEPYGVFQMTNVERLKQGMLARDFFMAMLNAPVEHIAVENPVPMGIYMLPAPDQVIQPYMFGDPYSKKTCLWLKNLPCLEPTNIVSQHPYINGGGGRLEKENYKGQKFASGSSERSKTFPGIAKAMADQWGWVDGPVLIHKKEENHD